ncbi:putative bifunctional diguanylate cyclase/phosphodiesterase [Nocardioides sp.]|jgi:diguanylate cyclase (GGDEF)-like protein/PAS domain S-box-containing protein|uniref:putative bifunctional diguanylate cyclase/phosphodiesterase n=1 Tax=Nocardioides sp. TaxID=35761 RepID=UPI002C695961|nr:EAL domain-containing protein [Nocardioides sp.]HVX55241.1 EAL domain-containing protein [Nocardioides sp.]
MIETADDERDLSLMAGIFDAVDDDGLILLDEAGHLVAANPAALRDLRYAAADLIGRHVSLILPGLFPDDPAALLDGRGRAGADDPRGRLDVEAVRSDGSTFPVRVGLARLVRDEGSYYLCTCHDTTKHREDRSLRTYLARHDRATGCLNRFGVEDHLEQLIESRPESPLAVVYLDLNGLMTASDSYPSGVAAGLVTQAVTRLRGALREQDRLARVGRHEFVAVVMLDDDAPSVGLAAQRLSACLQAPLEAAAWRVPVRASIGLSLYPEHARTPDRLIDRAEAAMRRAKRSETQSAQLYSVEDQRRDEARDEYLERVRIAAERGEFTLYYQPQFDLATLRTTGLEALLRWQHPDEGLISPGEFLSLVVECGLMPMVSRWVLREAVAFNTQLAAEGLLDVPVAVNIGPEIFEDRGFVDLVTDVLDNHGMAADRLEIEMTEATAITDPAQVAANARALRSLGVGVAIDDFGTGFSSLNRLRLAEFSKLKIDRTFVSLLPGDARDQAVIAGLLDLAGGLDMQVVAEGIETEEQLRALRMLGCRYGQGFWYGRPMAEDVLRAWIGMPR